MTAIVVLGIALSGAAMSFRVITSSMGILVLGFPLVGQQIPTALQGTGSGLMATVAYLVSTLLQYLVGALLGKTHTPGSLVAIDELQVSLTPLVVALAVGVVCSHWLRDPESPSARQG